MDLLNFKVILRYMLAFVFHFYGLTTTLLWFLTFTPLKFCSPSLYWWLVESLIGLGVNVLNTWSWAHGYDIVQVGDDLNLCVKDGTLVLANHQSEADILLLFSAFNAQPRLFAKVMWVMNDIFKYTSFGIVSLIRKDFFILTGRETRELGLVKLREHLKTWYFPLKKKLLVVFPEGGFLYRRLSRSQSYALKNNLPVLNNVSLPRLGAVQTIVGYCGRKNLEEINREESDTGDLSSKDNHLKWILDVTIAYPEGKPLYLTDMITGKRKPCKTTLFYRLFHMHHVPTDPEEVKTWLYNRWQEKDKILAHFYNTGKIPVSEYCSNPLPLRPIIHNPLRFLLLNIGFILSFCVHCRILYYIYCTIL